MMKMWRIIVATLIFAFCEGSQFYAVVEKEAEIQSHSFPRDFSFGAATAAYQIEGAWDQDGKGPSIWDTLTHNHPELIADHSTANVAADSYHFYKKDISALKQIGFKHYRFSVAWSRVFPFGPKVNEKAFNYYNQLIDELIINNIEPIVTMYHYDLPQWVQDEGGFLNTSFIQHFEQYADTLFKAFGLRVKVWITFNEPFDTCLDGYGTGRSAPLVQWNGVGEYICGHNLLLAHAHAYQLYQQSYVMDQRGIVGISLDGRFYYPKDSFVTEEVAQRALAFDIGWFANPIFSKDGGYPKAMVDEIDSRSKREGRQTSRLPTMTEEQKTLIKGSADFLGYNYYSSRLVELNKTEYSPGAEPSWLSDSRIIITVDPNWKRAKSTWLYNVPQGLHDALAWFKVNYDNPRVLITENGWSDDGEIEDDDRVEYLKSHLIAVAKAINENDCNVIGWTGWSIIDNFEWLRGYTEPFGLFAVNFTSPTKERIPKKSAGVLHEIIKAGFVSEF